MLKRLLSTPTLRLDAVAVIVLFAVASIFFGPLLGGKKVLPQSDVVQAGGMQKNVRDYRERTGQEPYWSESMFAGMPATTISVQYHGNVLHETYRLLNLGLPYPIGMLFWGMLFSFLLLRTYGVQPLLAAAGGVAYGFFTFHIAWIEAGHTNKIHSLMMAPGVLWALALGFAATSWKRRITSAALLLLLLGWHLYFNHLQMTYYLLLVALGFVVAMLVKAVRAGQVRNFLINTGTLGTTAIVALLINAAPIYPLYHYANYTIRGPSEIKTESAETQTGGLDRDYAFGWSYGRDEMLTLLIPNTMGGASSGSLAELGRTSATREALKKYNVDAATAIRQLPGYWGEQAFTAGPIYLGAVVIFCFVLGVLLVDGALKWALLYTAWVSVLLALGRFAFSVPVSLFLLALPALAWWVQHRLHALNPKLPRAGVGALFFVAGWLVALAVDPDPTESYRLSDLLMDYLPLYNKFRVPSSMLVIAAMTVPWLGLLGAQAVADTQTDQKRRQHAALWAAGLVGGLCALVWAFGSSMLSFVGPRDGELQLPAELLTAIQEDRLALMQADAIRSLLFVLAAGGAAWAVARGSLPTIAFGAIVLVLVSGDLIGVDRRFIGSDTFVPKRTYDTNFEANEAEALLQRDTTFFRVFPLGRNPFNDGRTPYFLNSVGGYNAAKLRRYQQLIERQLSRGIPNVINMLNTKYILAKQPLDAPVYRLVAKTRDEEYVYENLSNYGAAWLVPNVLVVPTADAALDTLDGVRSLETAVVEAADQGKLSPVSTAPIDAAAESIVLTAHGNPYRRYSYRSPNARFVTLSEVYYPEGWVATVDGQEVPIIRTNFVLRGLCVPAGSHTIELKYDDPTAHASERVSLFGSIVLGLLLLAAGTVFVMDLRYLKPEDPTTL